MCKGVKFYFFLVLFFSSSIYIYSYTYNGQLYAFILGFFITFYYIIRIFIMLHQKNEYILPSNWVRVRYVCNKQDWT